MRIAILICSIVFYVGMNTVSAGLITDRGTQIDSMDNLSNWTIIGNAVGNVTNNSVNFVEGTQGITIKSYNLGMDYYMDRNISNNPINLSNYKSIDFWVYVPDISNYKNISSIIIALSNKTDFSKFIYYSSGFSGALSVGWNHLVISKNKFKSTGGDTWETEKKLIRLRVKAKSDSITQITFDVIRYGMRARPVVILTIDDGLSNFYDNGSSILISNDQKATFFVSTGLVETAGYVSWENVTALYNIGWDISSHLVDHVNLLTLDNESLNKQLKNSRDTLISRGYARGANILAYPFGGYNESVANAAKSNGYVMARTIEPGGDGSADQVKAHLSINDNYNMYLKMWGLSVNNVTDYKRAIDDTINNSGVVVLIFHQIVKDSTPVTISTQLNVSTFKNISDYIKSRSADIDIMTMSEYYERSQNLSTNVYIPPNSPTEKIATSAHNSSNLFMEILSVLKKVIMSL
jgi:peptidoglycan/xylan/chitin deacetylase (PgdA/CDA1 family)